MWRPGARAVALDLWVSFVKTSVFQRRKFRCKMTTPMPFSLSVSNIYEYVTGLSLNKFMVLNGSPFERVIASVAMTHITKVGVLNSFLRLEGIPRPKSSRNS